MNENLEEAKKKLWQDLQEAYQCHEDPEAMHTLRDEALLEFVRAVDASLWVEIERKEASLTFWHS